MNNTNPNKISDINHEVDINQYLVEKRDELTAKLESLEDSRKVIEGKMKQIEGALYLVNNGLNSIPVEAPVRRSSHG